MKFLLKAIDEAFALFFANDQILHLTSVTGHFIVICGHSFNKLWHILPGLPPLPHPLQWREKCMQFGGQFR
jgi:hypothetical protein